jgi:glutaminyl-tRNA synthetase
MNDSAKNPPTPAPAAQAHFIEQIIQADAASGKWGTWPASEDARRAGKPRVHTRFPPEPNGYLHLGHAKSIILNSGLAARHHGKFNLRFDDTNPSKEDREYIEAIKRDVRWLGADYEAHPSTSHASDGVASPPIGGGMYHASDYFERMYDFAVELIKKGKAYVCELSGDEVSKRRGTVGVPASSPFRDRPVEESLRLFGEMRAGKHANGAMSLRAKIDLASPNFNLRDPVMYRIVHESHPHVGDKWCLYPMYDWAHGIEDSIEGITHSICTLEFEDHRPLYDWFIGAIDEGRSATIHHSQQIEFAKYRPTYTVLSKRNLLKMVEGGVVRGWDDPRMPTLAGIRRRGFTPEGIRAHIEDVGVTKVESRIDVVRLENAVRDHLNRTARRAMAVLRPLRVVIENWPKDAAGRAVVEHLNFVINPEDPKAGTRTVPFAGEIYIEQDDFAEVPPKGFHRLAPGVEVRLRWAYFITCTTVDKDASGRVTCVRCTYDPATRGGDAPPGADGSTRKPKGTLHWVSAPHAIDAEVRLFERLFSAEEPGERTGNWMDDLNPKSLEVISSAKVEAYLEDAAFGRMREGAGGPEACPVGDRFQFERLGYFCVDPDSGSPASGGRLVFNRTLTLKDGAGGAGAGAASGAGSATAGAPGSTPGKASAGGGGGRVYTLKEAALDLKLKIEKLEPALVAYLADASVPMAAKRPSPADFAARDPKHLTLDEFRAFKEWVKKNPIK